ncbi:MAG TPA: hypothetical protein EYG16_06650 [Deltaproteobacteria bacterium]|nr:hypothetical protein [Candidatus Binatota bacterium]HIL13334.1 hypothetical protein [Deltaproteobacteria bacterium]
MKLRKFFVTITVTLVAIVIVAPAGAQLKCKAKQDKKTGAIGYSFVNKAGGTVVYSLGDYDFNDVTLWRNFANEDTCQAGGKGRNCVVSNDAAEAAIAPSSCKIYMGDATSGDKCELYIKGCQVARRPLPTTGYFPLLDTIGDNPGPYIGAWDADTGIAWLISPDNQARSLNDHKTYLADVLNGGTSDGVDYACLTDGCDLELPRLAQLEKLGADCAGIASLVIDPMGDNIWTYTGAQADLCAALWPDPDLAEPGNCAWTSTLDATQPNTHAYAVCLQQSGSRASRGTMVEYDLVVAMIADAITCAVAQLGSSQGSAFESFANSLR